MNKILLYTTIAAASIISFLILNDDEIQVTKISEETQTEFVDNEPNNEISINYEKSKKEAKKKEVVIEIEEQDESLTFDNVYILSEASTDTFSIFLISDSELTQPQNMFPQIPAVLKGTINSEPFSIMIPVGVDNNDMRIRITNHKNKITKEFRKLMTRMQTGSSTTIHFDFANLQSAEFETKDRNQIRPSLPTPF